MVEIGIASSHGLFQLLPAAIALEQHLRLCTTIYQPSVTSFAQLLSNLFLRYEWRSSRRGVSFEIAGEHRILPQRRHLRGFLKALQSCQS
jgi:hypothetical protein